MVTRGRDNWEQHKADVKEELLKKYEPERVQTFIKHYEDRYNRFGRNLISPWLAWALMDDYFYVKNKGSKWYAFVGVGGTGKTTIAKNIMYFHDSSFNVNRMHFDYNSFTTGLQNMEKMNACFMDEPDDELHPLSLAGRKLRSLCGKARFKNWFVGICATDLMDIPPFIYKKLSGIIFLPYQGKGYFFKDTPEKGIYVISKIRKDYKDYGYEVFLRLAKNEENCLKFDSHNTSPIPKDEEIAYMEKKEADFDRTIKEVDDAINSKHPKGINKQPINREVIIKRMTDSGLTKAQIGEVLGLAPRTIKGIKAEMRTRGVTFRGDINNQDGDEVGESLGGEGGLNG